MHDFINNKLIRKDGKYNQKRLNRNWFENNNYHMEYGNIVQTTCFLDYKKPTLFERVYCINNNINEERKCLLCKMPLKFNSNYKYLTYCSSKCKANSNAIKEKTKKTNVLKYGVENP